AEVLVGRINELVEPRRTDDDDLQVERDGLGSHSRGGHRAGLLGEVLDAYLASGEAALERLEREGLLEHVLQMNEQEATVRAMQRTRLDLAEVRHRRTKAGAVLDPADQVVVGRVALDHDR